jgi:hypothetical protein
MPAFTTIPDEWIDPDSPVKQELLEAEADRDDFLKTTNPDGSADTLRAAYDMGHTHDGSTGQGNPIPAAGIDSGGVWKPEHVADGACIARTIASTTMGTTNFAAQAVTADQMTGDATTGMLRDKGVAAGPFFYDATDVTLGDPPIQTVSHSAGLKGVVVNVRTPGWFVFEMGPGSMRVAPTNTGTSNTWSVECDII